jgi:hypothetical protein
MDDRGMRSIFSFFGKLNVSRILKLKNQRQYGQKKISAKLWNGYGHIDDTLNLGFHQWYCLRFIQPRILDECQRTVSVEA